MLSFIADVLGILTGTITLILLFREYRPKLFPVRTQTTKRGQRSNRIRKLFSLVDDNLLYLGVMAGAPVLGAIFSEYLFGDRLGTFVNWNPWGVYLMIFSIVGSLIMTTLPQGPGKVKYGNFKPMIGILVAFFIIGMVTRILITEGTTFFAS